MADRGSHEKNENLLLDSKSTVKLTFLSSENKKTRRFNTHRLQKRNNQYLTEMKRVSSTINPIIIMNAPVKRVRTTIFLNLIVRLRRLTV